MTHTKQILEASSNRLAYGAEELAAAIDAASDCVQSCSSCASADLDEQDVAQMRKCIALCLDCADVCGLTVRMLSRVSYRDEQALGHVLRACVRACEICAEECARHAEHHRHCAICEQTCRACLGACAALLAS
jgi:Domain of Unknown Function (DUF326)